MLLGLQLSHKKDSYFVLIQWFLSKNNDNIVSCFSDIVFLEQDSEDMPYGKTVIEMYRQLKRKKKRNTVDPETMQKPMHTTQAVRK